MELFSAHSIAQLLFWPLLGNTHKWLDPLGSEASRLVPVVVTVWLLPVDFAHLKEERTTGDSTIKLTQFVVLCELPCFCLYEFSGG